MKLCEGLILFTYLHLAACPDLIRELLGAGVTALGYETVQEEDGSLPLLAPMSEVAGRMAVQIGARRNRLTCSTGWCTTACPLLCAVSAS